MDKKQKSVWSVSRYGLTFLLLVIVVFGVLSSFIFVKLAPILTESSRSQNTLAREELSSALTVAIESMRHDLMVLANWDEAKQQIGHPAYYIYWHDYRVRDSGLINSSVAEVALYDAKRRILVPGLSKILIPDTVNFNEGELTFTSENGKIFVSSIAPIYLLNHRAEPSGFVLIKVDLLKQFELKRALLRVKPGSLRLSGTVERVTSGDQALEKLSYEYIDDASHSALASLLINLIYQSALLLLVSALLLFWFLHYRFARPLRQLSDYIDKSSGSGSASFLHGIREMFPVAELDKVRSSLHDYQGRLIKMQSNLEASNAQLWSQAHLDSMTSAYNRRAFDEDWSTLMAISKRREVKVCLMLFDCDHFKPVNDTYGHHVGDDVIRGIAMALQGILRTEDKLYRLGGDEFACIFSETSIEEAKSVASRAEKAVAAYDFASLGIKEPIRISVGLAFYQGQDIAELDKLSKQADIAMYWAKRPGNSKVSVYDESMTSMSDSFISSVDNAAVYEALVNPEVIHMYYQPIGKLPGKEIEYYESLVRLIYNGKLITPNNIFPVVEARRLEAEFDLAVVNRISLDFELGVIPKGSGVSINISGPGILKYEVIESLYKIAHWTEQYKLVIEVTETALITKIGFATANLQALRKLGYTIALDDFGSGYSSMRYLSNMPVDTVKFDISLIRNLAGDDRQREIVENLAHLIKHAGYQMVAEGVEDEAMLQKVIALGFSHVQGYYLGKPARLHKT